MKFNYFDESLFAVTISDDKGIILYMNQKSQKTFAGYGGETLIGKSLFDCHPEPSRTMLSEMMQKHNEHSYTIEKNGIKKLIHQTPWLENGEFKGYIELSIEIPADMSHFVRQPSNV